jgi:hypothetical protein
MAAYSSQMADAQVRNPLRQLRDDVRTLQKQHRHLIFDVKVPRVRASEVLSMTAADWESGSSSFLGESDFDYVQKRHHEMGPSALTGLTFGFTRIIVADNVEDDCELLTVVNSRSFES